MLNIVLQRLFFVRTNDNIVTHITLMSCVFTMKTKYDRKYKKKYLIPKIYYRRTYTTPYSRQGAIKEVTHTTLLSSSIFGSPGGNNCSTMPSTS